jgi:dedicator of cytokinesis protein 3
MLLLSALRDAISWIGEYLTLHGPVLLSSDALQEMWSPELPIQTDIDLRLDSTQISDKKERRKMHEPVTNLALWSGLLNLSLNILMDPGLATEYPSMNPAKKAYLLRYYNDFRLPIIASLSSYWSAISSSGLSLRFAYTYTVPLLALACSPCEAIEQVGKSLLLDVLRADFELHGRFFITAPFIYDCVSTTVFNNHSMKTDPRYIPSLSSMVNLLEGGGLSNLFKTDPVLNCDSALNFVSEMSTLLGLLRDLKDTPETLMYEEERCFAYTKLMDFFLSVKRRDEYIKTAHNLSKEMAKLENYVEAANAILLHYNLLSWTNDLVDEVDLGDDHIPLPNEESWVRKKTLLELAISLFEQGGVWEGCISLLDEMAVVYKTKKHDYKALVSVLDRQADFYGLIASSASDRCFPTMFRVGYYGQGYKNDAIRNKEVIYRGAPLESIMDFSNRVKQKYPQSEVLPPKVNPTPEDHFQSPKQYLQISKVTSAPIGEALGLPFPDTSKLPVYIRDYMTNFNVKWFYYQRPFRKRAVKSANEFLDLWVEKKYLETSVSFPTYNRRAEVSRIVIVILNPIEMAIQGLLERNTDLDQKNKQMESISDGQAGQAFTMSLR